MSPPQFLTFDPASQHSFAQDFKIERSVVELMRGVVNHGSSSLASSSRLPLTPLVTPFPRTAVRNTGLVNIPPPPRWSGISRRHQSTSSSRWAISSFFSRQPPPPSSHDDLIDAFQDAIASRDLPALQRAYDTLSTSSLTLPLPHLEAALTFLSSPSALRLPGTYQLFKRIYDDLPRWGVELEAKHHRMLVSALLGIGRPKLAASAAHDLGLDNEKMWREILKSAIALEPAAVDDIWAMLAAHVTVGPAEYTLLLSHLHINLTDTAQIRERMTGILRDLRDKGEWVGPLGEAELVYVHVKLGDLAKAEPLVEAWDLPKRDTMAMWNAAAELEMAKITSGLAEGVEGVEEVVRGMLEKRIKPIQRVVTFLVLQELQLLADRKSSVGLEDVLRTIDKVEGVCKVRAGSAVWAEIIYFLSHSPTPSTSNRSQLPLEVYHEAKSRGVDISSGMARNLIRPLCLQDPPDLVRAMAIYADWSAAPLDLRTAKDRERALDVYIPLLKACAAAPGAGGTVIRLLSDLRSRGLPLPSGAAVSLAISLMRQASDHAAAFNIYAHFYALNSAILAARDYDALLTAFLSLRTPTSAYTPPHLYLEIVKDMKRAGHAPSSHVISALLQSYAAQATRTTRSSGDPEILSARLAALEKSVVELHTVLRLDPLVEVDVSLLSSLMDAYNRLGAWSSAFEVWADLVERRPREDPERVKEMYGAAISVVLDACGRSDQLARARRIWAWAGRHGLRNGKHYETWVEALCRLGQMEEALEVVLSMKNGQVELGVIETLARFSMEDGGEHGKRVREALEEAFPREWKEVRRNLTSDALTR